MFIEAKRIRKSYGGESNRSVVLQDVSFSVEQGSVCVVLGASGSGKSTLLNLLGGIDRVDAGELLVGGMDIVPLSSRELLAYRKENLGFVFQFYNLVPNLTLEENILVGGDLSDSPMDLEYLLERLDLKEHRRKFPAQLSGGQQQRCSIARALMKKPRLLLCDEPTGALDYKNSKEILNLLERVNQDYGMTILMVTHNTAFAYMADRIITLRDGMIEEDILNENKVPAADIEW